MHWNVSVLNFCLQLRLESALKNSMVDWQLMNSCDLYETGKNDKIYGFSSNFRVIFLQLGWLGKGL